MTPSWSAVPSERRSSSSHLGLKSLQLFPEPFDDRVSSAMEAAKTKSKCSHNSVVGRCVHGRTMHMWHSSTLSLTQILSNIFQLPPFPTHCWYLPAIIWSKPTGGAFCSWFQFPPHTGGMSALKSLIEMDWVIQLTPTRLGVLCAAGAFALGDCNKSLSRYRNSTPVLAVFIKPNWVERCHLLHIFVFFFFFFLTCNARHIRAVDLNT